MTLLNFLLGLISLLTIGIVILLKEYFKKKGEYIASQEEIGSITREKKKVEAEFEEKIEAIKKNHQLDIEKRKHQYAAKHAEFKKFFSLLDEFNRNCHKKVWDEFNPLIVQFNNKFLDSEQRGDKDASTNAIADFSKSVLNLTMKMNEESVRLRNETNSIRLIAPKDILSLIDELDVLLVKSFDASMNVVKGMATLEFMTNPSVIEPLKTEAEYFVALVKEMHDKLMHSMREHLDSI